MKGKLILVGAGPGDPELISLKGVKALKSADVVLYDALVHPSLLDYAPVRSKKIYVGKRAGKHSIPQEETNQLIVEYALAGNKVVRLKGGDPFIFGRGKEELEYAETFGIETESVIGISSINLPGHYGIPLTRRGVNESFWVITASTRHGELSSDIPLAAQSSATAVILMGLGKIDRIIDIYHQHGKIDTPVAVISKGSLEDGGIIFGRIDTIIGKVMQSKPEAPALIVIGEAVGTHEYFYEKVPELNQLLKSETYDNRR